jgi:predicted nuclease of predicted toxin-antitoxin system
MKVLLDHNIPHGLRHDFPDDFDVQTASHLGWANDGDSELLEAAVEEGVAVLVTIDSNLRHQQHLPDGDVGVVILNIQPAVIGVLREHVDAAVQAIRTVAGRRTSERPAGEQVGPRSRGE